LIWTSFAATLVAYSACTVRLQLLLLGSQHWSACLHLPKHLRCLLHVSSKESAAYKGRAWVLHVYHTDALPVPWTTWSIGAVKVQARCQQASMQYMCCYFMTHVRARCRQGADRHQCKACAAIS